MADELLSIEGSSLQNIANAIRTKGGTHADLEFPSGFVTALQAIETEATVTPKITPQQVTLTPSNTSFAIDAGFHDGTGTVSIQTEAGSANPTSTQQTYTPSAGKFFSSFTVGGIGSGKQVFVTTKQGGGGSSITLDNLPILQPTGVVIGLYNTGGSSNTVTHFQLLDIPYDVLTGVYASASSYVTIGFDNTYQNVKNAVTVSDYTIKVDLSRYSSSAKFSGLYQCIVFG